MKKSSGKHLKFYGGLGALCLVSVAMTWFLRTGNSQAFSEIAAIPAVAALLAALFQLVRDQSAHDRAASLQENGQLFQLAAMSHMAKVSFDKYVEFAEGYYAEANFVLAEVFQEGPTIKTGRDLSNLNEWRRKYRLWITTDTNEYLDRFQKALTDIGLTMRLLEAATEHEEKDRLFNKAHDAYAQILGLDSSKSAEVTHTTVVEELRKILGTDSLARQRDRLISG
ncbi:hypothetical protein [Lysobacter sp. CA199]|uniref:hypothetical protein n=1 Tax=Lysobacter sp. CA199 TaxID=3455608 RepID=UPI003F8D5E35